MGLKTWRLPPPISEQNKSERRYKKVIGIIKHQGPIDVTHIQLTFSNSYDPRKLKPTLKQCMHNGHIRRAKDGFVVTDKVD
jgi:carbohydrate-selective porin OprB